MVRVAVVQAAPVVFDLDATVEKVRTLTGEAAGKGAQLVLFPEAVRLRVSQRIRFRRACRVEDA